MSNGLSVNFKAMYIRWVSYESSRKSKRASHFINILIMIQTCFVLVRLMLRVINGCFLGNMLIDFLCLVQISDLIRYDSSKGEGTLVYILTLGVVETYRKRGIGIDSDPM
jgi:hypothetical protein